MHILCTYADEDIKIIFLDMNGLLNTQVLKRKCVNTYNYIGE